MRVALIEFNTHHEEVLPTFVRLLNQLGIEPEVYLTRKSAARDPFVLLPELRFRRRRYGRRRWLWGIPLRLRRYDVLIVNSMEPGANAVRLMAGFRTPVLGVMHNLGQLAKEPYASFFAKPRRRPLVLARHIAATIGRTRPEPGWITHVEFGRPDPGRRSDSGIATFAVSGNVEFQRRDYDMLLDAVTELAAENVPFRVRIIGRSENPDGRALRARIEALGLTDRFEFTPGIVPYSTFYERFASSDFVLPLLDAGDPRWRAYVESKLASVFPFAIGLGVPLVVERGVAGAYDVAGCGITYKPGTLAAAMRLAIASSTVERAGWQDALASRRASILDDSLANLRRAMAEVVA